MISECRVEDRQATGLKKLIERISADTVMVEIGSYAGESSVMFAEKVARIYCIDPWRNFYDVWDDLSSKHRMKEVEASFDERTASYRNIIKIKAKSIDAVRKFEDGSLGFVYIDGRHRYEDVKLDISLWRPKIRKAKGMIGGHDYASYCPNVMRAVDDILSAPKHTFEDGSWLSTM